MRSYISVPQHKDDSCSGLGDAGNVDLELLLLNGICISQTGSLTHYIKHTWFMTLNMPRELVQYH